MSKTNETPAAVAAVSLMDFFGIPKTGTTSKIVIIGKPEETDIVSSDGIPYFRLHFKDAVNVKCSMDRDIVSFLTDEALIRKTDMGGDWTFVNGKDPSEGYFMEGWVVDFSKGQEEVLYQKETIAKYISENRKTEGNSAKEKLNKKIADRMKERGLA